MSLRTEFAGGVVRTIARAPEDGIQRAARRDKLARRGLAITFQQFVAEWQGHGTNPDENPYGFQCVELVNEWLIELGLQPVTHTNALDFATVGAAGCTYIMNTPAGVPGTGDIVIWTAMPGDPFGHVDVFGSGDVSNFDGFDQNWPLGSLPHMQQHNYSYVIGWLHPGVLDQPPVAAGQWLGTIDADGGAFVHTLPGLDTPHVPQPGPNPEVVDKGTVLVFDAWCRHGAPIPDAVTGAGDDRWFRTVPGGHWIASAVVNGNPASGVQAIADPNPPPPGPGPTPDPAPPPFSGDVNALAGCWIWEWNDQADYADLAKRGFAGVLIRAANGEGGSNDTVYQTNWQQRAPQARAAGLKALAWSYWYGPGDAGYTEPDAAAYHLREEQHTARLGLQTPAWVIDFESRDSTGLAAALKALRDESGKAVLLCPPGDPREYGDLSLDWKALDAVLDGYVPQFYTGAWDGKPSLNQALSEWSPSPPLFPACDDDTVDGARLFVEASAEHGFKGYSCWRAGTLSSKSLAVYVGQPPPPTPQPPEPPTPSPRPVPPSPPADFWSWLSDFWNWIRRFFGG